MIKKHLTSRLHFPFSYSLLEYCEPPKIDAMVPVALKHVKLSRIMSNPSLGSEFVCLANQHPKNTIKKKAHKPLRTPCKNASTMLNDHKSIE